MSLRLDLKASFLSGLEKHAVPSIELHLYLKVLSELVEYLDPTPPHRWNERDLELFIETKAANLPELEREIYTKSALVIREILVKATHRGAKLSLDGDASVGPVTAQPGGDPRRSTVKGVTMLPPSPRAAAKPFDDSISSTPAPAGVMIMASNPSPKAEPAHDFNRSPSGNLRRPAAVATPIVSAGMMQPSRPDDSSAPFATRAPSSR
ncbi:MAG: hypothetical protein RBU37_11105, partial [Myxococcota bacterium]|nr:hypothetical protein [Myxococcota bacterium]